MSGEFHRLSLTALADAIATGEISSEAATRSSLDRLKRIGPALNCIARLDEARAMECARAADLRRSKGGAISALFDIRLPQGGQFG